jgi:hypothetical protein
MELHCRSCEVQWLQAAGAGCFSCGSHGRPGRLAPLLVDPMRGAPVLTGPRLRPGTPRTGRAAAGGRPPTLGRAVRPGG